jgi:hypothetical protein
MGSLQLPQPWRGGIWKTPVGGGKSDGLISPLAGLRDLSWMLLLPRLPPWATRCRPLRGLSDDRDLRLAPMGFALGCQRDRPYFNATPNHPRSYV